jgi:menaquinone-dependent protoporphyrinogen oxidase
MSALVVYASTHGHTDKIAARVSEVLGDGDLRDVASVGGLELGDYDTAVIGASIHVGHHQKELVEWCARQAGVLKRDAVCVLLGVPRRSGRHC